MISFPNQLRFKLCMPESSGPHQWSSDFCLMTPKSPEPVLTGHKCQRKKRRRLALEKRFQKSLSKGKGKEKESVHPEPSSPIAPDIGNIRLFEETPVEERLDWGTNSANDDHSDVDDEIAESAGLDTGMYHTSHLYNDRDGHDVACYDHYC